MRETLTRALAEASATLLRFQHDEGSLSALEDMARMAAQTFRSEGRVLACGNGGSMADAMHFAEECTGRFRNDRRPYAAIALCDPTHLSCVANDFGYDHVFERLVLAYARPRDLLIVLSTSGESENLILAAKAAKERGAQVAGLLGRGGGRLAGRCDCAVIAPGETSDRIQEIHMLCLHALVEAIEADLEFRAPA